MRISILADVHANLPALEAVVRDLEARDVEGIWHLGDVIGYGAEPFACVQMLSDMDSVLITGNHEEAALDLAKANGFNPAAHEAITWTRNNLSDGALSLLAELPLGVSPAPGVYLFHGLPGRPGDYLRTSEIAEKVFMDLNDDDPRMKLAFFGHTHRKSVFTQLPGTPVTIIDPESEFILAQGRKYLINPGSVGQPRNGDPRAHYLIYDTRNSSIEFHLVEYDVKKAQSRILEAGLPPALAARLSQGI